MKENSFLLPTNAHNHYEPESLFGTTEHSKIWFISNTIGIASSSIVISIFIYSWVAIVIMYLHSALTKISVVCLSILLFLSLWSMLKVMFTNPGAVESKAEPLSSSDLFIKCKICNSYKPHNAHHDRVSNRCIIRMDHYCPWTNNTIGLKNQKHFLLFLVYTFSASLYLFILVASIQSPSVTSIIMHSDLTIMMKYHRDEDPEYVDSVTTVHVNILCFVTAFSSAFTSTVLITQLYGLAVGQSSIERIKAGHRCLQPRTNNYKAPAAAAGSPFSLVHILGDGLWIAYLLPIDPTYRDPLTVEGYRLSNNSYQHFTVTL